MVVHHFSRVAIGNAAVCVFFVLSGYWIARMWRTKYSALPNPYVTFAASRMTRLLPMFLLVNAAALLVARAYTGRLPGSAVEWLPNLLILGYSSLPAPALVVAWSLDLEMQFYLAAPALIGLIAWRPGLALGLAAVASVASLIAFGDAAFTSFLVFFAAGMAADATDWRPSPSLAWASLSGAAGLFGLAVVAAPDVAFGGAAQSAAHAYNGPLNIAVALFLIPFALATVRRPTSRNDGMMGDLSYIVYLLHWPAAVIVGHEAGDLAPLARLPYVVGAIGAVVAISWCFWAAIDRPLNRLRGGFAEPRHLSSGVS